MLLTVIIVNYNVKHYLYQCLESLRRAGKGLEWEVYVVDNNSSDGSVEFLYETYPHEAFPELHIIANKDNPGFGKANNQAFVQSKGTYVLYLNPDTFVGENALRDCLEFMQQHPDAGCLGVKMLNADGSFALESRRGVPTPWASFCKISRMSKLFPKNRYFGRYYLQHLPVDKPAEVEIISGACMMVKRDVVEKVGIFDEDYFMYCEDTDLAYRMLKSGYQNYYLPTQILHYKGESTRRYSYAYVNMFYKAILIFFRKHFSSHLFLLRTLIYIAIYVLAGLSFVRKQYSQLKYYIKKKFAPHKTRLLCLTDQSYNDIVSKLDERYGLNVTFCNELVEDNAKLIDLIKACKPDFIVYDTTLYSFDRILTIANTMPNKQKVSIGTLYPEQNMILTSQHIFTC